MAMTLLRNLSLRRATLLSEMEALKKDREVTDCTKGLYSSLERLQRENSILLSELGAKDSAFFNGAQELPAEPNIQQLDNFVKVKIDQNVGLREEAQSLTSYLVTMEKEREKDLTQLHSLKNELGSIRGPRTVWGTPATPNQIRTLEDFPTLGNTGPSKPRATTPSVSTFTGDSSASSADTMCQLLLSRFDSLEEVIRKNGLVVAKSQTPATKPKATKWADAVEADAVEADAVEADAEAVEADAVEADAVEAAEAA